MSWEWWYGRQEALDGDMGRHMFDKGSTMEGKLDKKSARTKGKQDRRDFFPTRGRQQNLR